MEPLNNNHFSMQFMLDALGKAANKNHENIFIGSTEKMLVAIIPKDIGFTLCAGNHSHDSYEFIIPHSPMPFLHRDNAVYFGEPGKIYPVKSGELHGVKYSMENVWYTEIIFDKDFFEKVLSDKGVPNHSFDAIVTPSFALSYFIELFTQRIVTLKPKEKKHRIEPFAALIADELITLSTSAKRNDRKKPAEYAKGITGAIEYINNNLQNKITLAKLSEICGLTPNYFSASFKNAIGESPQTYIAKLRLARAKELLIYSDNNISEIADICGYSSVKTFSDTFRKNNNGTSPTDFRKQYHFKITITNN